MSYPPPGPQGMYPPPQAYAPPMMQPPTPPRAPAGPRGRRRYGIVRTLLLGLFSADVWRDVAQNWRGMGLLYMLVLLTLSWFVVLGKFHVSFGHFVDAEAPPFVEQVPAMTIKDGVVSIDRPSPYVV